MDTDSHLYDSDMVYRLSLRTESWIGRRLHMSLLWDLYNSLNSHINLTTETNIGDLIEMAQSDEQLQDQLTDVIDLELC